MMQKKTGTSASGRAQPEIRPGDKWRDSRGSVITISEVAFNRVTYTREGYENPCVCSPDRLRREFVKVASAPQTFTAWREDNDLQQKVQRLRNALNARRGKS